jgi:hypothetical protein
VVQAVDYLLCKHKTLISNPNPTKKNSQRRLHIKKYSKSLLIREMQIKTTPSQMTIIKKINSNKYLRRCGKMGYSSFTCKNVK